MFGKPTETEIILEGKRTTALLDTGSTVSTVSKSYYTKELSHFIEMRHLNQILDIECAGGTQLPYDGYIEADIKTPGNSNKTIRNIMLVVPDTQYNQHIPVLLGTNVLQLAIEHLKDEHGARYLQTASLTTPWFTTLRCLTLREKELKKNDDRLAVVKTSCRVTLPPNSVTDVKGFYDKELPYQTTASLLQSSTLSTDYRDFDVEPTLRMYHYRNNGVVSVKLANTTTRTLTIPSRGIICEIQPVTIQKQPVMPESSEMFNLLAEINITESDLSQDQLEKGKQLLLQTSLVKEIMM